jgi:4-amino-4-deoxy-L-arabinose transferase-like glycosyltransferase
MSASPPTSPLPPDASRPTSPVLRWRHHWTRDARGALLLIAVCLILHAPGARRIPPIDRDEARFAEASRQMAASEDWRGYIVPMFDGKPRLNKPPLIYWLQSASAHALGTSPTAPAQETINALGLPDGGIGAYRIPSICGALLGCLATWWIGRSMFGGPVGWLAGVLLAASLVVLVDARQARADQVLLACTTWTLGCLWQIWRHRDNADRLPRWIVFGFWIGLTAGVLVKGPVTPAAVVWTATGLSLLDRRAAWLRLTRPIVGVIVMAALIAPWVIAVGQSVGWERYGSIVADEVLGRSVSAKEGHSGPPGYHLLLMPLLLWPGCLGLAPGFWLAWRRGLRLTSPTPPATSTAISGEANPAPENASSVAPKNTGSRTKGSQWRRLAAYVFHLRAGRDAEIFCLLWLIPGWLLFEIVATKLPHYTLPMYPALALLLARGLCVGPARWQQLRQVLAVRLALWGWLLLGEVVVVLTPLALAWWGSLLTQPGTAVPILLAVAVNQSLIIAAGSALRKGKELRALLTTLVAAGVMSLMMFPLVLPQARPLWISSRLMQTVATLDPAGTRPVICIGYDEDSLVFLTHARAERISKWRVAELRDQRDAVVIIETQYLDRAPDDLRVHATVSGFNYSNGRQVEVAVAAFEEPPEP